MASVKLFDKQGKLRVRALFIPLASCALLASGTIADARSANPPASDQAKRIIAAFQDWATYWGVPNGSIAIMSKTKLTGSAGFGTYGAKKPETLGSTSKAVTAICAAQLAEAGDFKFSTQLKSLLRSYFRKHPPADPRAETITVGQLLTHSSGISYDPSQGNQGGLIEQLPPKKTNFAKQAEITFAQNLGYAPGTTYDYNNMNYSLLGLIIETVTGQEYESYCNSTVLQPVGVTDGPHINPKWEPFAAFGSWEISADDYTRFLEYYLPSMKLLGIPPAKWPQFDLGGGAFYSLGTLMRAAGTGYNFWHTGSITWSSPYISVGSYFGVLQENVRYMAEFSPTVSDDAFGDLDSRLYNAATGTKASYAPAHQRTDLLPP
jgi:CubicO group peptidase (beta-lactamase class C family)